MRQNVLGKFINNLSHWALTVLKVNHFLRYLVGCKWESRKCNSESIYAVTFFTGTPISSSHGAPLNF